MSEADKPVNDEGRASDAAVPPPSPDPVAPATVTSDSRRPVWSDQGDIPFDDGDKRLDDEPRKGAKDKPTDDGGRGAGAETLEMIKTIVFGLLIALVLRAFLLQPFTIPSASMEPNLYEGDYIVVSKWSYGYSKFSSGLPINLPIGDGRILGSQPERGDIVVFKLPRDDRTDYIKRVIGLPGDSVQMIDNRLFINGQPVQNVVVDRQQVADMFGPRTTVTARETLPEGRSYATQDFGAGFDLDDTPVFQVPQGHYFMMGDNRDNSIDSRVDQMNGVGLVPEENLVGKAQIILFSWTPGASLFNPVSWFANLRPSRFFTVLN